MMTLVTVSVSGTSIVSVSCEDCAAFAAEKERVESAVVIANANAPVRCNETFFLAISAPSGVRA